MRDLHVRGLCLSCPSGLDRRGAWQTALPLQRNTSSLYVRWVQELGILGKGFKGRRETLREDGWLVAVPVPVVLVKIDLFLGMCSSGSSPGARATRFSGNIHSRFAPTVSLWRCFTAICLLFSMMIFGPHRHPSPPRVGEADFGGAKQNSISANLPSLPTIKESNTLFWGGLGGCSTEKQTVL